MSNTRNVPPTMKKARVNPRSIRGERLFLPNTFDQALEIRDAVIESGLSPNFASALMTWLILKAEGRPDTTAAPTRAKYRRALATLDSPGWAPRVAGQPVESHSRVRAA